MGQVTCVGKKVAAEFVVLQELEREVTQAIIDSGFTVGLILGAGGRGDSHLSILEKITVSC